MRLLYLNSRSPDYVEDLLFAGLTERLGAAAVVPWPVNPAYYLPRRVYPRDMGRSRPAWRFLLDRLALPRRVRSGEFDAIVLGSLKRDTFEHYLALEPHLPKALPVVFIDGGDRPEIGGDAQRLGFGPLYRQATNARRFALVFKRERLEDGEYGSGVIPFPMAWRPVDFAPSGERAYDVTLWCVESDPVRTAALELIQDRYDCRANGTTRGQTFRGYRRKGRAYLRELSLSRIALNFRGVGWDTVRYWEVPGAGVCLVGQRPRIVIPDNFRSGEHCLFCRDDLSDLLPTLDRLLADREEREAIAAAGRSHLLAHHTYLHRADQFLAALADARIGG